MKRIISLLLSLVFVISLAACGGDSTPVKNDDTSTQESESPATSEVSGGESYQTTSSETSSAKPDQETTSKPQTQAPETKPVEVTTQAVTEALKVEVTTSADTEAPKEEVTTEKADDIKPVSNNKVKFSEALGSLLDFYKWNPKEVIPSTMTAEYQSKSTNVNSINSNYTSFVSTNNIPKNGMGEQWNMVVENIEESQLFFNVLGTIDTVASSSVVAFNNYLDKNPSDTAHHEFKTGDYYVTINCTEDTIYYVLTYSTNLPVLGKQDVQIALSMNMDTQVKTARIQLGDSNALVYTVDKNVYTFAIKYLNLRYAYFDFYKNPDGSITGHIYEYLKASSVEVSSSADFYINKDYITVVGNKASGLIGFTGTICELYDAKSGKMLAYEVKESAAGITYNTLWFNLYDVEGLTSIRHNPKTEDEAASFSVNDKSSVWEAKKYGLTGGLKAASRRFDLEFRTQYFYYYDSVNEKYVKKAVEVPMLFVQEEVYSDLSKDVKSTNGVEVSVSLDEKYFNKLTSEYDTKIEIYENNKNIYTIDNINKYIGEKVSFK